MLGKNKLVTIPQLLYTILSLAGIRCNENPSLTVWKSQLGMERKLEIVSMEQFVKTFGEGVYQIYVKNPEISSIDPEPFKVKSLSITIAYEGDNVWSEPEMQTEEEEITPDYMHDFANKAFDRAGKITSKVKEGLLILSVLVNNIDFDSAGG